MLYASLLEFLVVIYIRNSSFDNRIQNFRYDALSSPSAAETCCRPFKMRKNIYNLERTVYNYQQHIQEERYPQLHRSENTENSHSKIKCNFIL
jgi:hypothetical protein